MSRSIKKGPYVAPELLKRVEEMNAKGEKNVLDVYKRQAQWMTRAMPALSCGITGPWVMAQAG